mmetsp:Transcript_70/g.161  ORF Transcript_70/g.161 Transcript_70/m.161 type:complete len:209 (-) Transcript_70:266-892(-)
MDVGVDVPMGEGPRRSTSARSAHIWSWSTAPARKVSHAASKTFWFPSTRKRFASFPMVVVLPIPLAPMTKRIVGILESLGENRIADAPVMEFGDDSESSSAWLSAGLKSKVSMRTPRMTLIRSSRDRSSTFLPPSAWLLASVRDLTSLTMSSEVATPKSACNKTSCKSSRSSSRVSALEAPNNPSKLLKNLVRDMAKPSAKALLETSV